jgi:hypothetical protein
VFKIIFRLKFAISLLFVLTLKINAQTIVHNTGLNVIYAGFPNKLQISNENIKRENLVVECLEARIVDSIGFFFVTIAESLPIKEIYIKLKDKNKQYWEDSLYYRVKKVPKPSIFLGSLHEGKFPKVIICGQSFLNVAFPNLINEHIKGTVLSYKASIINPQNMIFYSEHINGNRTNKYDSILARTNGYAELLFDSIKYELFGKIYYAEPMRFETSEGQANSILKIKNKNNRFVEISAKNDNFKVLNKSNHVLSFQIINGDTFLKSERIGHLDSLVIYKKYRLSKTPTVEFVCQKTNDSTFFLKAYDSSQILLFEGYSSQMEFDYEKLHSLYNFTLDEKPFDFEDIIKIINNNSYLAKGQWHLYNTPTNEVLIAYFKSNAIQRFNTRDDFGFYHACGNLYLSEPTGVWVIKDKKGKILKKKKFN